jgi:hypothetical protein
MVPTDFAAKKNIARPAKSGVRAQPCANPNAILATD